MCQSTRPQPLVKPPDPSKISEIHAPTEINRPMPMAESASRIEPVASGSPVANNVRLKILAVLAVGIAICSLLVWQMSQKKNTVPQSTGWLFLHETKNLS